MTNHRNNRVERRDTTVECDGLELFVREILPSSSSRTDYLLFVHGNTFPSLSNFDLPLKGYSLTEYLAQNGINCCIFDHRGYGASGRPSGGSNLTVTEKARDLEAVYRFLTEERGATSIGLVGLSAGCNTIAEFLSATSVEVASVVFLSPTYLFNPFMKVSQRRIRLFRACRALIGQGDNVHLAISKKALESRLYRGEEEEIDREAFERFVDLAIELTQPKAGSQKIETPVLSFPNPKASYKLWQPLFETRHITSPTLIVRGEQDDICCEETAERLSDAVAENNPNVQLTTFGGRKHDMHLYRQHEDLFSTVLDFVQAPYQAAA